MASRRCVHLDAVEPTTGPRRWRLSSDSTARRRRDADAVSLEATSSREDAIDAIGAVAALARDAWTLV
jgi:hypothetical protein